MGKLTADKLNSIRHFIGEFHEVKKLFGHIDAIELELKISKEDEEQAVRKYGESQMKFNDALAAISRHGQTIVEQRKEIEGLREAKKVVLPREVARAFDAALSAWKGNFTPEEIALFLLKPNRFSEDREEGSILKKFAANDPIRYTQAIANSYTVEQSKEEQLHEGVKEIICDWYREPGATEADAAKRLVEFFDKFQAENS